MDAKVLARLDAAEISEIARWYEAEARRLRLIAAEREARQRQRKEADKKYREWDREKARLCGVMLSYMADGMSREKAINTLFRQVGMDEKSLAVLLKNHIKADNQKARDGRRITAIRLAQRGWSNEQIAAELDVHPNTIGRDLKRAVTTWRE